MSSTSIETLGLTRRFGPVAAVDDLSLAVPVGSVFGFLGLNGAGKTTTIRLLLGLLRATRGEVRVFGLPLAKHRLEILGRIGALVETPAIYPHLTGRENLEAIRRILGLEPGCVDRALADVGLSGAGAKLARSYSLGMKQRLGLAQCLLGKPELLILDEPTNGLDPEGIQEVRALIRRLPAATGATVFLSSHILAEVEQVATHIGVIHRGRLRFQGTKASLATDAAIRIEIGVADVAAAARDLASAGWSAVRTADARVVVTLRDRSEIPRVNADLVRRNHEVFRLAELSQNLEDAFFRLIGEQGKREAAA